MRRHQALLLILMAVTAPSCSRNREGPQQATRNNDSRTAARVILDDEHNIIAKKDSNVPSYKVAPSFGLVLDTKSDKLTVPAGAPLPNAIHLYQTNSANKYRVTWKPEGPNLIAANSVECLEGEKAFVGFRSGQAFIIAIGHDNAPTPPGESLKFIPMWVAKLEVVTGGN